MTPTEAVKLCRLAKAYCPQQQFDEYSPDAWGDMLEDTRFEDARLALKNVAKSQPFVSPSEVLAEVKRIRRQRISDYGPFEPPPDQTPTEYARWLREMNQRIGDGELVRLPQLERAESVPPQHEHAAALLGVWRKTDGQRTGLHTPARQTPAPTPGDDREDDK